MQRSQWRWVEEVSSQRPTEGEEKKRDGKRGEVLKLPAGGTC